MQEGTTWEALQFAVWHNISGLTVIIDNNRLQAMDYVVKILDKEAKDKIKKLKGFGLAPQVVYGHDVVKLAKLIRSTKTSLGNAPKVIIADTIKGFGLKCMENVPKFHFRIPTKDELCQGRSYEYGY